MGKYAEKREAVLMTWEGVGCHLSSRHTEGAVEMTQWVKCCLHSRGDLVRDPQHPHKRPDTLAHISNPSGKTEIGKSRGLLSSQSPWFSEKTLAQELRW